MIENLDNFLRDFSKRQLRQPKVRAAQTDATVASGWLGFPGAKEEEIAFVESRLGVRLPRSYRQFIATSNGWRHFGDAEDRLLHVSELALFWERHAAWADKFLKRSFAVTDAEYFVYGAKQAPSKIRCEYLPRTIEISSGADGSIFLLNPQVVGGDGEWEAWYFANWLAGAIRYESFAAMLEALAGAP